MEFHEWCMVSPPLRRPVRVLDLPSMLKHPSRSVGRSSAVAWGRGRGWRSLTHTNEKWPRIQSGTTILRFWGQVLEMFMALPRPSRERAQLFLRRARAGNFGRGSALKGWHSCKRIGRGCWASSGGAAWLKITRCGWHLRPSRPHSARCVRPSTAGWSTRGVVGRS